jgi:hypothetical protein
MTTAQAILVLLILIVIVIFILIYRGQYQPPNYPKPPKYPTLGD